MSEKFTGGVLVTGSTGYIGGSLAGALHSMGEKVIPVSRSEGEIAGILGIEKMDSTNPDDVKRVISKYMPKYIYDFVGWSKPSDSKDRPDSARALMVDSLQNLFNGIQEAQRLDNTYSPKQIIIATSVAAFGPGRMGDDGKYLELDEESGWLPNSEYGKIKAEATDLALALGKKYGINVIAAIQANAGGESRYFGVTQRPGFIIPDNIEKIINILRSQRESSDKNVPVLKTGSSLQHISMTHIDEMVEAYIRLGYSNTHDKIIVGASKSTQVKQIIEWMIEASKMTIDHDYPDKDNKTETIPSQYYSTEKLKKTIGFVPRPINKEDIEAIFNSYKKKYGLK